MTKKYLHNIDAARGIAILLVLSYHTLMFLFPGYEAKTYSSQGILELNDLKALLLNFNPIGQGWMGVELFLVISGFLIHYIYLQNKQEFTWAHFFSKRFWRIYPPYAMVLLFFFIHRPDMSSAGFIDLGSHLLLLHNLTVGTFFSINPSFWSIALECQLYLIYPAYLLLYNRLGAMRATLFILSVQVVFSCIALAANIQAVNYTTFVLRFWFVWAIGAYLAHRYYHQHPIFKRPLLGFIALYISFFVFKVFYISKFFILIPASLSCIALLEYILYRDFTTTPAFVQWIVKFLSFTGIISYSIYLIHQPYLSNLILFLNPQTGFAIVNKLVSVLLCYVTIYMIAFAMYKLVELPSIDQGKSSRAK